MDPTLLQGPGEGGYEWAGRGESCGGHHARETSGADRAVAGAELGERLVVLVVERGFRLSLLDRQAERVQGCQPARAGAVVAEELGRAGNAGL